MPPPISLMMDSGAFSAWRLGKSIDIDKYCRYLHENLDWISTYVGVDVVIPHDPEAAAKASWDAWLYMRKQGLPDAIPVFHARENIDWLHRYLDAGAKFIGIAGSSIMMNDATTDWYAAVWDELVTSDGLPVVKTHALGEGRPRALLAFPWGSADSTSWIHTAQRKGGATLSGGAKISARNDGLHTDGLPDIERLSHIDRKSLEIKLAAAGLKPTALDDRSAAGVVPRTYLTCLYYLEMIASINKQCPVRYQPVGLVRNPNLKPRPAVNVPYLEYHLALGNNSVTLVAFAKARAKYALVSYYYVEGPKFAHFQNLKAFITNPIATCQTINPMKRYWDILEELQLDAGVQMQQKRRQAVGHR